MKYDKIIKEVEKELENHTLALKIFRKTLDDQLFNVYTDMSNAVTVTRMGYNDHGKVHSVIIARNSIRIFKILLDAGIKPTFMVEEHGDYEDSLIVTILGAMMHDLGNSIHRDMHQAHGAYLAEKVAERVLDMEKKNREYMKLAVMEAVFSHDESVKSTSIESGIVKVADGTDCTEGRARIPYKLFGKNDIHAISALAIKSVEIRKGAQIPVEIIVDMDNPAGMFQIQEVMQKKIDASNIRQFIKVIPLVNGKSYTY